MPLTQVEAWYLGECMRGEALLYRKLASYLGQVQDEEMRALLGDIQRKCERRIDLLTRQVT